MSDLRERTLRKLDEIGGDVAAAELAYQLGRDAAYEAFELAGQGLVTSKTYFSLTAAGQAALASSPGGTVIAAAGEEVEHGRSPSSTAPAPGPGGAGAPLEAAGDER